MDELDLSELDQAVQKMMTGKPAKKKPVAKKASVVQPTPAPVAATAVPVTVTPKAQAPLQPAPKPQPKPAGETINVTVKRPLPKITPHPRRGATMDIMAPQMPQTPAAKPPSAEPPREARTVQPAHAVTPEPPKPAAAASVQEPSDHVLGSLTMHDEPKKEPTLLNTKDNEWPDPLDFHKFNEPEPKPKPTEVAPTLTPEPTPPELTTTPFLATKVEKRPLGGYNAPDQPVAEEMQKPAPGEQVESPTLPLPPPKELSPEVVAVENQEEPTPTQAPAPPLTKPEPKPEPPQPDLQNLRQMAIPPQYKPVEKEPNTDTRPVYDTTQYHPPLQSSAPNHKKSHLGLVLTIVFVAIALAALYFAYYMATGSWNITKIL